MKALKEMRKSQKGFTLVEIMIVVLIIGILLAIAIPNFVRAREKSMEKACIANLKTIDSAVQQYMMENKGVVPTYPTDLVGADKYIKSEPQCPATTQPYKLEDDGTPICQSGIPTHVLP